MRFLKKDKSHKMYQESGMFSDFDSGAGALALGAGVVDFFQKRKQKKFYEGLAAEEADRFADAEGLYMKSLKDLQSSKYDREEMTVSPELAAAKDQAVSSAQQLIDDSREQGEEMTANVLNILDSGDPAQAALAIAQLDDVSGAVNEEKQKALAMANQATAAFGAEKAKVDQYNVGVRDDNRSRLAALANLELQRGASGMDPNRELQMRMTAQGITPGADALGTALGTYDQFAEAKDGMKVNSIEDFVGREGGVSSSTTSGEEFSHKRNPIHMIDKDGEKVGEMTGGEYILNPEHSGDIKELVDKGDAQGLLKYLDNLLSQPRFQ